LRFYTDIELKYKIIHNASILTQKLHLRNAQLPTKPRMDTT